MPYIKSPDAKLFYQIDDHTDPWTKPEIRGLQSYGQEDEKDSVARAGWTFEDSKKGASRRAECSDKFWPALHSDLRMVDTSDFIVAFCPTNLYSVGTPHEILLARQQRKPVLFVSPPVAFPAFEELKRHLELAGDKVGLEMHDRIATQAPLKPNPSGVPSQWYMPLIGGEHFFDGFGFYLYKDLKKFKWRTTALDESESRRSLKKPLLPFLAKLNDSLPKKWDRHTKCYAPNDDWLLWNMERLESEQKRVSRD